MTSRDEALRALEKAVELVAKATKGPWAFMNEKFDDCLLAFGTDSLEYDAPPPWYSCWTSINPDDGRALIAAVNFVREHGAAILSARQEVAPVAWQWLDTANFRKKLPPNANKEEWRPLVYISNGQTSEARDAYITDLLIRIQQHLGVGCVALNGYRAAHNRLAVEIEATMRNAEDAAMRQEGGNG